MIDDDTAVLLFFALSNRNTNTSDLTEIPSNLLNQAQTKPNNKKKNNPPRV